LPTGQLSLTSTNHLKRKETDSMYLPRPSESNHRPVPAGTWPAVCYRVIDLGTQDTTYQGERKEQHKVLLSFEITDPECVTEDGKPMAIHQRYTWSMHEKATLRKHLEAWRALPFTDKDFGKGGFNIRKLLGVPCMLSIIHNTTNERTFANIGAIAKLPKGMKAGELVNEKVYISLEPEEFDREAFAKLADGLKSTIMSTPEYRRLSSNGGDPDHDATSDLGRSADDQIPF
jgi:hypothetical protein